MSCGHQACLDRIPVARWAPPVIAPSEKVIDDLVEDWPVSRSRCAGRNICPTACWLICWPCPRSRPAQPSARRCIHRPRSPAHSCGTDRGLLQHERLELRRGDGADRDAVVVSLDDHRGGGGMHSLHRRPRVEQVPRYSAERFSDPIAMDRPTSPVAVIRASCRSQSGCCRTAASPRNSSFARPNAVRAVDCSAGDPIEVRPCSNHHGGSHAPSRLPASSRIWAGAASVSLILRPRDTGDMRADGRASGSMTRRRAAWARRCGPPLDAPL